MLTSTLTSVYDPGFDPRTDPEQEHIAAYCITQECIRILRRHLRSLKTQLGNHSKTHPRYWKLRSEMDEVLRDYKSSLSTLSILS